MSLWDTAGAERFRTLTASYYRGVHAYILVYDVSDRNSFQSLAYWVDQVEKNATSREAIKLVIANKIDQIASVDAHEGRAFAADHAVLFLETSAQTGQGVKYAFDELLCKVAEQPTLLDSNQCQGFPLSTNASTDSSSSCLC